MKRQKRNRALSLAVLALGFCGVAPGWAAVTPGGDTEVAAFPIQNTYVGKTGLGTLSIGIGSSVTNNLGFIGRDAGSIGTATVSGIAARWSNNGNLYVGYEGSGTLTVSNGGIVIAKAVFASAKNLFGLIRLKRR